MNTTLTNPNQTTRSPISAGATWQQDGDTIAVRITGEPGAGRTYSVTRNGAEAYTTLTTSAEFVRAIDLLTGMIVPDAECQLETAGHELFIDLSDLLASRMATIRAKANAFSALMDTMGIAPETIQLN